MVYEAITSCSDFEYSRYSITACFLFYCLFANGGNELKIMKTKF